MRLTALGDGTVEASGDGGGAWKTVGQIAATAGQVATVDTDLGGLLPTAHMHLRFRAAAQGTLGVTGLQFG